MRKQRFRNVGAGKGIKERLDPDTLIALLDEGKTQAEIAAQYGCTPQFVSLLVGEYGLRPSPVPQKKNEPA
jgi:hypothetical protein